MSEQELQQQIDLINEKLRKWEQDPPLRDHQHNGIDSTMVNLKDIDTLYSKQVTVNPSSLVDGAGETITVTGIAGAVLGDFVLIAPPYDLQGILVTAWVSANSTVKIRLQNETAGTIDLASGTWRITIIKKVV